MFKECFDASTFLDMVEEFSSEDGLSHKVVFRVMNEKAWSKGLVHLLQTQEDEPDFGLSIQKQYFLAEGTPSFIWVLLMWGDMEDALEEVGILIKRRAGPPAPPANIAPATKLHRRTVTTSEGWTRTETTVPLPHARGNRDIDPSTVKRPGTRGLGATVTTGVKE